MATTNRGRWIATCGATAAAAIGVWAAVATAQPGAPSAASPTNAPVISWPELASGATGYDLQRATAACSATSDFATVGQALAPASSLPDTPPAEGAFCYRIVGHYGTDPDATSPGVTVVYDRTAPTVTITAPAAAVVRGVVPIGVSSSEAGTTVVSTSPATAVTPTSWDTTQVADGAYTIRAVVTDAAGNAGLGTRNVTVDNTAPAAPAVTPQQTPVAGSPTLLWAPVIGETYRIARNGPGGAKSFPSEVLPPWTDPDALAPGAYSYVVTAADSAGNSRPSAPAGVTVITASATAPRLLSAASPTNAIPHLTWLPPVTFSVTGWRIYRDGVALQQPPVDPAATSFDDTAVPAQGSHSYAVQALNGSAGGDISSPVSVTYDTEAPQLGAAVATANPNGSVSLSWPEASDPTPGSGLAKYVVRRAGQASPADTTGGTGICTLPVPAATGCLDGNTDNGTIYNYSVFAIDGAGNVTRQITSARAVDTVPPDPVSGFRGSVGPTNAHLFWDAPGHPGSFSDLAGYRIIKLAPGAKQPTNPLNGAQVCPGLGFKATDCFVQNLTTGKPVTFAIYAQDDVPNYSQPSLLTITPNSSDRTKPGPPRSVKYKRVGARITMTWLSPKDRDLSHFRVTLYNNGPAPRPASGKAVVTGRVLKASFKLKAGQIVYASVFALDLSGNFSSVTKLIVMPDRLRAPKQKVAKKTATTRTASGH